MSGITVTAVLAVAPFSVISSFRPGAQSLRVLSPKGSGAPAQGPGRVARDRHVRPSGPHRSALPLR